MDNIDEKDPEAGRPKQPDMQKDDHPHAEFDFTAVFDVDDYMYFYGDKLTDERTEAEVSALVRLLELDHLRKSSTWLAGMAGIPIDWRL